MPCAQPCLGPCVHWHIQSLSSPVRWVLWILPLHGRENKAKTRSQRIPRAHTKQKPQKRAKRKVLPFAYQSLSWRSAQCLKCGTLKIIHLQPSASGQSTYSRCGELRAAEVDKPSTVGPAGPLRSQLPGNGPRPPGMWGVGRRAWGCVLHCRLLPPR